MDTPTFARSLALALALHAGISVQAQGLEEHIHRFNVTGISSTLLEKRCQEALLAFDPEMVVSIDRQDHVVKVKTMHDLPLAQLVAAMQQLGLVASIDLHGGAATNKQHP